MTSFCAVFNELTRSSTRRQMRMTQSIPVMEERKEIAGAYISISGRPSLGDGRLMPFLPFCSSVRNEPEMGLYPLGCLSLYRFDAAG